MLQASGQVEHRDKVLLADHLLVLHEEKKALQISAALKQHDAQMDVLWTWFDQRYWACTVHYRIEKMPCLHMQTLHAQHGGALNTHVRQTRLCGP